MRAPEGDVMTAGSDIGSRECLDGTLLTSHDGGRSQKLKNAGRAAVETGKGKVMHSPPGPPEEASPASFLALAQRN